jgi:hypothetical protein
MQFYCSQIYLTDLKKIDNLVVQLAKAKLE